MLAAKSLKNTVQEAVTLLMLLPLKKDQSYSSLKILNVQEVLSNMLYVGQKKYSLGSSYFINAITIHAVH